MQIGSVIRRDIDNTPEANMARRGINCLGNTCRRAITQAVIGRAEEGPPFKHFSWDADLRLCRINTLLHCPPSRIERDAASLGRVCWMTRLIPVRGPFPHIASHVIQTIVIRWEGAHGRRPFIAICHQVLPGELPLPGVGHHLATRSEFIPPGIHGTLSSPACGTFPLRLGRQLFPCPCRICQDCVDQRDEGAAEKRLNPVPAVQVTRLDTPSGLAGALPPSHSRSLRQTVETERWSP